MAQGFLIDMDGVIYSGDTLIPGADAFIQKLLDLDIPFTFMTNNSQRSPVEVLRKLKKLGISVKQKHVYTSAMATGEFLSKQKPNGTAYVLGEGGILGSLHASGYSLVETDPDFVVVGEGRNFTLEMVQKSVEMILDGARLIATNLDPSPRKRGWNNLGIAAIVAMIEEASGTKAFSVGKPSPVMMRSARKWLGLETAETNVIGDTMGTDIQGGVQMGYKTILVLSGVTSAYDINKFAFQPHMVVDSVKALKIPIEW